MFQQISKWLSNKFPLFERPALEVQSTHFESLVTVKGRWWRWDEISRCSCGTKNGKKTHAARNQVSWMVTLTGIFIHNALNAQVLDADAGCVLLMSGSFIEIYVHSMWCCSFEHVQLICEAVYRATVFTPQSCPPNFKLDDYWNSIL